jgi:uncharacterized protein (DUF302 family)
MIEEYSKVGAVRSWSHAVTQTEVAIPVSYVGFTRSFEALLGRMDVESFADLPSLAADAARAKLESVVGPLDFVLFQRLDHGAIVASLYGKRVRATTYVFGNALIAVEMTKHDLRAGLYVPLRLIVEEVAPCSVRLTYDLPSSLIASFGSEAANVVARELDAKVERLIQVAFARSRP